MQILGLHNLKIIQPLRNLALDFNKFPTHTIRYLKTKKASHNKYCLYINLYSLPNIVIEISKDSHETHVKNMESKKKTNWYSEVGWIKNPFSLDIYPALFAGHKDERQKIEESIRNNQKYILITGPTGIGKTTFLKWLATRYKTIYIPKPPINEKEIVSIFKNTIIKETIIEKIINIIKGSENINIYNLADTVNRKKKNRQIIIIVDEAHETSLHILEWLRSLTDHMENSILILAGLQKLKTEKLSKIETLNNRILVNIELETLTKNETISLIKKRIGSVGGQNINPFTHDVLSKAYAISGGFPRETIKICNNLIQNAIKNRSMIIDELIDDQDTDKRKENTTIQTEHITQPYNKYMNKSQITRESMDILTKKQKDIINILSNKPATPTNIINIISLKEYKTKNHALRAVNNILRRLADAGYITRERQGKAYIYRLVPKIKAYLIDA